MSATCCPTTRFEVTGPRYNRWLRLPEWGFLLVFYSNHTPKTHRFDLGAWDRETDRLADGWTGKRTLNVPYTFGGGA